MNSRALWWFRLRMPHGVHVFLLRLQYVCQRSTLRLAMHFNSSHEFPDSSSRNRCASMHHSILHIHDYFCSRLFLSTDNLEDFFFEWFKHGTFFYFCNGIPFRLRRCRIERNIKATGVCVHFITWKSEQLNYALLVDLSTLYHTKSSIFLQYSPINDT